jgi:hypothetical protein
MTQFARGRYRVQITDQRFVESSQKKTVGFNLGFRVLSSIDRPEEQVPRYRRELVLWVTEKTFRHVLHALYSLGYAGTTLSGVDPDTEGFHQFRGMEVEVDCSHESSTRGELFERWELAGSKPKLEDKSQLHHFDRLLNPESEPVGDGVGVTDDDVPF